MMTAFKPIALDDYIQKHLAAIQYGLSVRHSSVMLALPASPARLTPVKTMKSMKLAQ